MAEFLAGNLILGKIEKEKEFPDSDIMNIETKKRFDTLF